MLQELPRFWKRLSYKQKLLISALLPVVGTALFVGNIGIAALGGAVGVPVAVLVLILLFLSNGLIEALVFILDIFPKLKKKDFSYEKAENSFENFFKTFLHETFKTKFDERVEEVTAGFAFTGDKARDYEFHCVAQLAKEYDGKGYTTRKAKDGGIDGHVISNKTGETLLVQCKFYQQKVGYDVVTQCLGVLKYWQKKFSSAGKFPYPITKMIICCPVGFSLDAEEVAKHFAKDIVLAKIPFPVQM